jgi:hypothetical protein
MSTQHPQLWAALAAPFDPKEVKVRTQAGRQLSYVTARTVMNRLDAVLGPENWWNRYRPAGGASVLCALTVRLPDGSTVTKCDAGGFAGMADAGDDDKSGHSDALKRAAVLFGVGRYLYRDGVPTYAPPAGAEARVCKAPPAELAAEVLEAEVEDGTDGIPAEWGQDSPIGKDFYRWLAAEDRGRAGLMKAIQAEGRTRRWPVRIVSWDRPTVAAALAFAWDILCSVP